MPVLAWFLAGAGRCRLRVRSMKGYHDIVGDGGSRILE